MIGQNSTALLSILRRDDLTPTEKLAWVALCEVQASDSDSGSLYRRLAETMGLANRYDGGRESVKRAITSLRQKGLIGRTFLAIDPTTGLFVVPGVENTPIGAKNTPIGAENTPNGVENTPKDPSFFSSSSSSSSSSSESYRGVVGGGEFSTSTSLGPADIVEPFRRSPEDLADLKIARDRLLGSLNFESLANRLDANHEGPEYRGIAGWQWAAAALCIIGRKRIVPLGYLRSVAIGYTRETAAEIERQARSRPDLAVKADPELLDDNGELVKPLDVSEITDAMEAKFGTWAYTRRFAKLFRKHNGDFAAILAGGSCE